MEVHERRLGGIRDKTLYGTRLGPSQYPEGLTAAESRVAWIVADNQSGPDSITLLNQDSGERRRFNSAPDGSFGYPVVTEHFLAWAESSGKTKAETGGYLYRFSDGKLFSLGNASGLYSIRANGKYVTWQEASGQRPEDIVTHVGRVRSGS